MIGIEKSTRHHHIVGRFGEYFVCNWLSRSGFEVCIVDHTGLDVIAYHPGRKQRLGITVKSRTRLFGKEATGVNLFRETKNDRQKLLKACEAFNCNPWVAVYVECDAYADLFLTSLENYDHYTNSGKKVYAWAMNKKWMKQYETNSEVKHVRIDFNASNWWKRTGLPISSSSPHSMDGLILVGLGRAVTEFLDITALVLPPSSSFPRAYVRTPCSPATPRCLG